MSSAAGSRAPVCGGRVTSEPTATDVTANPPDPEPRRGRRVSIPWLALIGIVLVLDIVAFVAFPQVSKEGAAECSFPACFIQNSLEFPAPHPVIDLAPGSPVDPAALV